MIDYLKIFIALLFTLFFTACQNEEILGPDATYEEYTVVQAQIEAGKYFPSVRFAKTLPLGVPYNIKKAELKNVTAYLVKNEVQVIPLVYTIDGLYKPLYDFYVLEGETYELYAESDGKYIYGKTIIPFTPEITSTHYDGGDFYLAADIRTKANEVYCALWFISGTSDNADDFYSVTKASSLPNNIIGVRTATIPENYRSPFYNGSRYIQVFSFDKSFREYFYSRTYGNEIDDPFIQGGGAVEWNMQGDKVIGMFIGVSKGGLIQVN